MTVTEAPPGIPSPARLASWLDDHVPGGPVELTDIQLIAGGRSNLTYRLAVSGPEGSRLLVLRRPPLGHVLPTAHDMSREYRVLSALAGTRVPVAPLVGASADQEVIGAPFYVMRPVHGIILRRKLARGLDFSAEKARRLSASFIDNLVRLHRVDYTAAGLADLGKPEGYLERQVRGWTERYQGSKTHDYPEVEKITGWMQQRMPTSKAVSLIHNDYKYDNVVLDPTDITTIVGVLDWEMCTIGDPLADLGTALAYWIDKTDPQEIQENRWGPTTEPGSLTREEFVHHYAQKTGNDVSPIAFYLAFARFKLAVIVQQIYYRYHQGLTQDARFAAMPATIQMLLRASLRTAQSGQI